MSEHVIPLQDRPLYEWFPSEFEGDFYNKRILSLDAQFVHVANGTFAFIISSPDSGNGFRTYPLQIPRAFEELSETRIRGYWGEHEARILIKELLRRNTRKEDIGKRRFLKRIEDIPHLANSSYSGAFNNTYDLVLKKKENHTTVTDFDGILQYQFPYGIHPREGHVVVEAKTGKLERTILNKTQERKIYRKVIDPIKDIFGDEVVDYFLMGPKEEIYVQRNKTNTRNMLLPGVAQFVRTLQDNNIGCIVQAYPHSKRGIVQFSESAVFLKRTQIEAREIVTRLEEKEQGVFNIPPFKIHKAGGQVTGIYRELESGHYIEVQME